MGGAIERDYRRLGAAWKPVALMGLLFAAGTTEVLISGVPVPVIPVLIAVLLAADGWLALYLLRARTAVRASGITSYGALRARRWSWYDIQDLRVETDPHAQGPGPRLVAYLYDTAGGRTALPFVNDRCVPNLHVEVEILRGVLASSRGRA